METLTPALATELLERQAQLQREADALLRELNLVALLREAGEPWQVGSSVLGLMAWRDIDFNVLCDPNTAERAIDAVRPLIAHPFLQKLHYSNEAGRFNRFAPASSGGYYCGLHVATHAKERWEIDVWFLPPGPRSAISLLHTLSTQLTKETRLAILWLKDIWYREPTYRKEVLSIDIYNAVLDHGVCTPTQFDAYLRERGKPARTD